MAVATQSIDVISNNVNDAPSAPVLSGSSVIENKPAGTVVGTLSASDPDGTPLTYTLVDDAGGRFVLDGTVAALALPSIRDALTLSESSANWVISSYVLAFGGLMLLGGRLGDTFGRKRMFIVGVVAFTLTSLLCGLAWNEASLLAGRALQGASAAIAAPRA